MSNHPQPASEHRAREPRGISRTRRAGTPSPTGGEGRGEGDRPKDSRSSTSNIPRRLLGPRVFLRPISAGDGAEFIALNRASSDLHRGWVQPPVTRTQFAGYLRRAHSPGSECFFVCRREDGAIVGAMNFGQIFRGAFQSAYLGYFVGAPFAGRGYMTEAMCVALRHAFRGLKLHRVEANVQPGNAASLALVKRAGFRREGFSPRYLKIAGRWRDHERWALTVEDWRRQEKKG